MCMLFIRLNDEADGDEFSLIVASIRDEYFKRPTSLCNFWSQNPDIIGGIDLQEGREGGTWFAMNAKQGKIGALLNILQPIQKVSLGKQQRGFLVPEFLTSPVEGTSYLQTLGKESSHFADFLMVTIDFSKSSFESPLASYFTNMENSRNAVVTESRGILAFGNNIPDKPWIKTIVGRKVFENITDRNVKIKKKRTLITELFSMMDDETQYFPDEQLLSDGRGYDLEHLRQLSSIKVKIPSVVFGTRTQSIILVDRRGKVDFVERTFEDRILFSSTISSQQGTGISTSPETPAATRHFNFRIPFEPKRSHRNLLPLPIYSLTSRL